MKHSMSNHALERAAQRLCRPADLDLALQYGDCGIHGVLVTHESVMRAEREVIEARCRMERLQRLKGLYVPLGDDGTAITVQRTTQRKWKRIVRNECFA